MNLENFKNRLRRTPLRSIPSDWKMDILPQSVATLYDRRNQAPNGGHRPPLQWLQELFWPSPIAWASLAAVWIVLIGFQYDPQAKSIQAPIAELAKMEKSKVEEQKALLTELGMIDQKIEEPSQKAQAEPLNNKHQTEYTVPVNHTIS